MMNVTRRDKWQRGRLVCGALLIGFLAACAYPGMQVGVSANRPAEAGAELPTSDIYAISPQTIRRLRDEEDANRIRSIETPASNVEKDFQYQYRIGPQDILRVVVWDHPELNNPGAIVGTALNGASTLPIISAPLVGATSGDSTTRIVNDDGTMFYPYVGMIQVAGKSPSEVQAFLTKALARSIKNPQVEVSIATYRSKRVYLTGDVKTPGAVPISDVPLRVADAISAVGGANPDADLLDVTLTRKGNTETINLYDFLYLGNSKQNFLLEAGDVVNVPEQRFNKVFLLGEVIKTGSLPMPRGYYSLNEAMSDAGGASQLTAKASQIYVIRGTPDRPQIFHLDASDPAALVLADQFKLKPRDIIFVDATDLVRFSRVVNLVLPALQALQAGKYLGQ
jgi:polysaccharide export outer membrane protein